jgi:glutathione S-transferase
LLEREPIALNTLAELNHEIALKDLRGGRQTHLVCQRRASEIWRNNGMIKVWGRPTSINTQRVLWALADSDIPHELVLASATMGPKGHISKGGAAFGVVNTPAYRAMNPNGTVPTIDDDGFILWESNAILMWLALKRAPEVLSGGDPRRLARALQWMSWTNERLEPLLHTLVMELVRLPEAERDPAKVEKARVAILGPLGRLEAHLAGQSYVAGDRFTIGDIPTGAAVYRWLVFDLEQPDMPNIVAWQNRLSERKGFRAHVASPEFHLSG